MNWWQLLSLVSVFCCLGMTQQQPQNHKLQMKDSFNLLYLICTAFSRALTLPFRVRYGTEALNKPCLFALALLVAWTALSQSPFMLAWLVAWLICFALRRAETAKLLRQGVRIHSLRDGTPVLGMRFTTSEYVAKRFIEPLFLFVSGLGVWGAEADWGYPPGLGRFMVIGACFLPLLESIHERIWQKRVQSMVDARLEMEELRERHGE
jgi:hypothetical protein